MAILAILAARSKVYRIQAENVPQTQLEGKNWVYNVPFEVKNKENIQRLIQCESQGVNISSPDSDGIISDGILQYHRDGSGVVGSGTWNAFSKRSGIKGDPRIPADAIRMTDWAISNGLGHHWSCWKILKLK